MGPTLIHCARHTISPCRSHLLSYLVAGVHGAASAQVILTQQLFLTNQPCCNGQLGWTVFTSCKLYQGVSFISIFLHPYNTWKILTAFTPPWDVSIFLPRLVCPVIVSGCSFGFQRSSLHMVGCLAKKWSQVMGPDQKWCMVEPWLSLSLCEFPISTKASGKVTHLFSLELCERNKNHLHRTFNIQQTCFSHFGLLHCS